MYYPNVTKKMMRNLIKMFDNADQSDLKMSLHALFWNLAGQMRCWLLLKCRQNGVPPGMGGWYFPL